MTDKNTIDIPDICEWLKPTPGRAVAVYVQPLVDHSLELQIHHNQSILWFMRMPLCYRYNGPLIEVDLPYLRDLLQI
jgi:hypothetical protein